MRAVLFALVVLGVTGCAQQPPTTWIRTDGQTIRGDPVLAQALDSDGAICRGEMQKANLSGVAVHGGGFAGLAAQMERNNAAGDVLKGCMAQRGYALVEEQLAEQRLAEYRANAQLAAQQNKGQPPPTATGSIPRKK